jgi:hypothetical protein
MSFNPASTLLTNRRNVLAGFAGFAAALPVASVLGQEGSPVPEEPEELLFVQSAETGTAEPVEGEKGRYLLTLGIGSSRTLYFSDRPERLAGVMETGDFLQDYVAQSAEPPNAALAFRSEEDDTGMKVAVLELSDPSFDEGSGSVAYQARILAAGDLAPGDPAQAVDSLPEAFTEATLFIDGYPYRIIKPVNSGIVITR